MSSSSLGGLYSKPCGRLSPSQCNGTPGFMVSSDRKSIELTVCNPTIALSPTKKTLIQSLSLYLNKTDFQPHHRRCLFKKQRRQFWGCASLIRKCAVFYCWYCLYIDIIVKELAPFVSKIYACTVNTNKSWAQIEQPRLKCLWTAAACRREVTKSQSLSVNT